VIVDQLALSETSGGRERSARIRWSGGELRVGITAPAELVADTADASPFVAFCLLAAMICGEELDVDGPVSALLLHGCDQARDLYRGWNPQLYPAQLRYAETLEPPARAAGIACFFSRGVDSTYSAAVPRGHPGPLTQLVFVDALEPRHDQVVRAEEVRLAREVAARLDLPLAVASTNMRAFTDGFLNDWEDMAGAGLAGLATALAGGVGDVIIPSTDGPLTVGPSGLGPLIDPLFSTESVTVRHDSVSRGRVAKIAWLAVHRPALLPGLKVCFIENRPDNCGRCGKCLVTMAALEAVGKLRDAEHFPPEVSPAAIGELELGALNERSDWADVFEALDPARHAALRQAVGAALLYPAPTYPGKLVRDTGPAFRYRHSARTLALLRDGRPWPPAQGSSREDWPPDLLGLVRALDPRHHRHLYGAGSAPAGELVGELGCLTTARELDSIPLWMTPEGYLLTDQPQPAPRTAAPAAALRWVLAPLTWVRGPGSLRQRLLASLVRGAGLVAGSRGEMSPPSGRPLGYLHRDGGPDRVALFHAIHPVTGDQLLSTYYWEAVDLGYGEPVLLGHLELDAPVTGDLGTGRPWLPWASRFGQRVR
jgi:hypothetical protein